MTNINLKPFCCHEDVGRPSLENPFNAGNHTYASNGASAIRVPRQEGLQDAGSYPDPPANINKLFDEAWKNNSKWQIVDLSIFYLPKINLDCKDCDGDGEGECQCNCLRCTLECLTCDGAGFKVVWPSYEFSNQIILSGEFIQQLSALPKPVHVKFSTPNTAVCFKGKNWEAIILPMTAHSANPHILSFPQYSPEMIDA